MILPDKNIKLEYSLLNCGALVLESLEVPRLCLRMLKKD